jgi:hypothetical protein
MTLTIRFWFKVNYQFTILSYDSLVYYTFIACWWGKYENLFTQEYQIPWGQWYSWVNKFSYFLNPHAINVFLYRKNHIPWNKYHIPPPWKSRGFSRQSYRSLTGKRQRHSERITCKRPLQCCCGCGF